MFPPSVMKWVAFVVVIHCIALGTACPASCMCKWKGGKQTVECVSKGLLALPEGMDPGTQVLDFAGNNLQYIQRERFHKMELINLQKIYMSRCRISRIDDRAFTGLTNLVELDLSQNLLNNVPTETFSDYPSLMRLTLSENPIRTLRRSSFQHLSFLTTLELSNCQIELIEDEAFIGLDNLEWLRLNGNKLSSIRGAHILPESLHGIDLHHNRWQCDCKMLDLHTWLQNFNVPQTEDPKCVHPSRLVGHSIKSLKLDELACLPDVSPTTLYLEIGEGKNISLLCKITAIPEATVSWWYQGQILQNDSMVAPGLHLYYYIEEGAEEKRSELFIFNTNIEDNGTFVCSAENTAGRSQSNYTIRVIVKEEPVVVVVSFPFEYFVVIAAGAGVLLLIIVIGITIAILRCKRNKRRRKKKESSKEVALQHQNNQVKCSSLRESTEQLPGPKVNGNVLLTERQHDMMMFAANTTREMIINEVPPVLCNSQYCSPPSVRNYTLEQNPDLINDTESVGKGRRRVEGDGDDGERENSRHNSYQEAMENVVDEFDGNGIQVLVPATRQVRFPAALTTLPRGGSRELYQHTADVHLNPGCFLDGDGYPIDFGLPKIAIMPQMIPADHAANFYRTLPHNRSMKMQSAATPGIRYSREAEFLSRSSQAPAYEHYSPADIRYTVDGYPCTQSRPQQLYTSDVHGSFTDPTFIPSPPEGYKTDSMTPGSSMGSGCCPNGPKQWPACLPGYNPHPPAAKTPSTETRNLVSGGTSKRCSSAQTTEAAERDISEKPPDNTIKEPTNIKTVSQTPNGRHLASVLTESPDEGYVGEVTESSEI